MDWNSKYLAELAAPATHSPTGRSRVRHPTNWGKIEVTHNGLDLHSVDLKNVWVWSDQHFGHKNVIKYSNRPFAGVDEMNTTLVNNFNSVVPEDGISLWVGDVAFLNDTAANEILSRCNGYKILVVGNHDFNKKKLKNLDFDEIHLTYCLTFPDIELVFTHYPLLDSLPSNVLNVHGHIHAGAYEMDSDLHINVNCEFHNYTPINMVDVLTQARTRLTSQDK